MELSEVVERCKAGDKEAQTWLYKTYSQKMLRICRGFVSDRQVALDLMHDGFVVVLTSIGSLQQPAKLENWMSRIMTNLTLRYLSQQRAGLVIPLSEMPEEEPDNMDTALDLLSLDVLLGMIEKLPEGYRRVFKLSVIDGLSHKEIAELLQIAPHSSSSQFFRAREYLKRLIVEHQAKWLLILLLLLPLGYLLWRQTPDVLPVPDVPVSRQQPVSTMEEAEAEAEAAVPQPRRGAMQPVAMVDSPSPDVATISSGEVKAGSDSIKTSAPIWLPGTDMAYKQTGNFIRPSRKARWTLELQYGNSRSANGLSPGTLATPKRDATSMDPFPPYVTHWDDYYHYMETKGRYIYSPAESKLLMEIAGRNSGRKIEEKTRHYIPFTIGLMFQKTIDNRWGVETGIQYTRLESEFSKGEGALIYEQQRLQYIGIPLRATYQWGRYKRFSFYSSAGITLEVPVSGTLETKYIIDGLSKYDKRQTLKVPIQGSIDGGLGIQYRLTPAVGIFAEPKAHYYFDDRSSLRTIRKEHPFGFTLPVGIRWTY